jgi:hypothetical protein
VAFAEDGCYLRLYSNHDFVSNGLVIVDTPGLQDTNARAYELTLNEIPKADAVLMLFNAEVAGYGEAEREFLENVVLPNDVNRKFFPVCNKIDLLSKDGEVERLLKWLQDQLPRRLGDRRVIPVSARWALDGRSQAKPELIEKSRICDLERSIQDFLKTNRQADEMRRTIALMSSMAKLLHELLLKKKECLELGDKDQQSKRTELKAQMDELRRAEENRLEKNKEVFDSCLRWFDSGLRDYVEELKLRVWRRLQDLPLDDLKKIDRLEANLSTELNKFFTTKLQELEVKLSDDLESSWIAMQGDLLNARVRLDTDSIAEPWLLRNPEIATLGTLVIAWPVMGIFSWAATAIALALGRQEIERVVKLITEKWGTKQAIPKLQEEVNSKLDRIYSDCVARISENFKQMEQQETKAVREQMLLAAAPIRTQLEEIDRMRISQQESADEKLLIVQYLESVKRILEDCFSWGVEASHV